jgi:hypothetical protein
LAAGLLAEALCAGSASLPAAAAGLRLVSGWVFGGFAEKPVPSTLLADALSQSMTLSVYVMRPPEVHFIGAASTVPVAKLIARTKYIYVHLMIVIEQTFARC